MLNPQLPEAFRWIVSILRNHHIPFQVTGGLAAHSYGSDRPINDIDIDIPEERMKEIVPDILEHIEFGPARYQDRAWDLMLITLNYHGQIIDIGGSHVRICDERTGEWHSFGDDFSDANERELFGMHVPVMHPAHLIAYKKLLTGDHQLEDIAAVEHYIASKL